MALFDKRIKKKIYSFKVVFFDRVSRTSVNPDNVRCTALTKYEISSEVFQFYSIEALQWSLKRKKIRQWRGFYGIYNTSNGRFQDVVRMKNVRATGLVGCIGV